MKRRIYLDLDGVMADFDGSLPAVFGLDHRSLADDAMWLHINGHPSFFRDLPPMAGAVEFFRSIEHLDPIILTACPKSNYAHVATQKVEWVRTHLSAHVTVLPVLGGSSKPLFMHAKGDILIDDFRRNTEAWAAAGGHAILHRGFDGTAAALAEAIGSYTRRPAQPVEAVGGVTDQQIIATCNAAGGRWIPEGEDDFPGMFDLTKMSEMRALFAALAHPRPTGAGCPCEPSGSDGLRCPGADGKLLCDPASSSPAVEPAGEVVGRMVVHEDPLVEANYGITSWKQEVIAKMPPGEYPLYAQPRPVGVPDGPLTGKYADVLVPFVALMERELHANAGKGDRDGWLAMTPQVAMLEIHHHVAKLQKAALNGDITGVCEYAADVANMSMMAVDVCGALIEAAPSPAKAGGA